MTFATAEDFASHCYMRSMAHAGAPSAVWQSSSDDIAKLATHCFALKQQGLKDKVIARKLAVKQYGSVVLLLTWIPFVINAFKVVWWIIQEWNKGNT